MKKIYSLLFTILVLGSYGQSYTSQAVITGLYFPVSFEVAPDGRFFVTEKGYNSGTSPQNSRVRVYSSSYALIGTFYDLSDSTISSSERGVLGIALDPDFSNNHYVYVYYNHLYNGDQRIRIVRFTEASNTGTNPTLIFDLDVADNIPGNHVGGNLHFRPSEPDKLYFTIGDLGLNQTNPTANYANKKTNPYGKILRINKDGSIPTDNPFYDNGNPLTGNCDWIWSYGHRNPFDFCFSPANDSLYASENGLYSWDEANLIRKGKYYGWAECEGNYLNNSTTAACNVTTAVSPITTWGTPLPAVTGILFYSGSTWSAINNHLIIADNNNGNLYDCTLGNPPYYNVVTNKTTLGDLTTSGGLTALRQSNDGCIYAMHGGYTFNGNIYKVCPISTGISQVRNGFSFAASPNPVTEILNLEMAFDKESEASIEITDINGRVLFQKNMTAQIGKHKLSIDMNPFLSGIYFVQLKCNGQLISAKKIAHL